MSARVTGYSYSIVVGLLVRRRTMFRNCRILYLLGLLVVFTEVFTTQTETDQLCILGEVPDLTVWLNCTLTVVFNATKGCKVITLFRDGEEGVFYIPISTINGVHTIDVPSIAERFNNATMTLRGADKDGNLLNSTEFKLYTVDNVSAINNLTHSSNCTHTTSCWDPPYSHGLEVTDYWHELRLNGGIVESGVTSDLCVVFNLTTLPPNEPGYSLSVWAHAPPGNGTVTNTSIAAAATPNVSYSTDTAMVSQGANFILVGEVNLSCLTSYPTMVTVSFSCVPGSLPSVRSVCIGTNGSTKEIHSDDIETGHIGCIVPVTTSNLSGKNISEIFSFNSTDVQLLDAKPSELMTGAIDLWMKLAINSSLRVIEVNVTNSRGNLVNSTRIERPLHQREVKVTTDVLPVEQYTVRVNSCFNKSLTISKTINITHSNYSTPSPSTTTAVSSPTRTVTPTAPTPNDTLTIVVAVVIGLAVIAAVGIPVIIILAWYWRKHHGKYHLGGEHQQNEHIGLDEVHLQPPSPVSNGAVHTAAGQLPPASPLPSTSASTGTIIAPLTPPPASASTATPSTNTTASIDTTVTAPLTNYDSTGTESTDSPLPPITPPINVATVAEPTDTTVPKDTTVAPLTGAAAAAEPSEHDQSTAEPTTGAVQATQLDEVPMLVSMGGLTRQRSLSIGASLVMSVEPTLQETATSTEGDELLAVPSVPPAPSSMSEMVTTTQPTTDITTENSTVGSETALIDTSPPAAAHKPIAVRALAAVRKRMPTLFTARATETQQPIQETTTASFDSERPLLSQKEPSSPSSYGAVKSEEKELYQAEPEEETNK